jgi:hypothetical protein
MMRRVLYGYGVNRLTLWRKARDAKVTVVLSIQSERLHFIVTDVNLRVNVFSLT